MGDIELGTKNSDPMKDNVSGHHQPLPRYLFNDAPKRPVIFKYKLFITRLR